MHSPRPASAQLARPEGTKPPAPQAAMLSQISVAAKVGRDRRSALPTTQWPSLRVTTATLVRL